MAEQPTPINTMHASFDARRRERCILFENHDQFSILYIPPFLPTLQARHQKHSTIKTV
jgi:hypothetical protein